MNPNLISIQESGRTRRRRFNLPCFSVVEGTCNLLETSEIETVLPGACLWLVRFLGLWG
ncbi:hypothetical protein TorRG33x02_056610 [Trema orientale]|uniref:Uncharacterized protein n=1 Tax=Trema orientale TaxID=63057 RepID=A0A2P5FKW0_TREOI|nr:hypothetical protein TorRG33x02_056610 [Trema orientale]